MPQWPNGYQVARQFREIPGLLEGTPGHGPPDHARCIKISTDASLREMILPGAPNKCQKRMHGRTLAHTCMAASHA